MIWQWNDFGVNESDTSGVETRHKGWNWIEWNVYNSLGRYEEIYKSDQNTHESKNVELLQTTSEFHYSEKKPRIWSLKKSETESWKAMLYAGGLQSWKIKLDNIRFWTFEIIKISSDFSLRL